MLKHRDRPSVLKRYGRRRRAAGARRLGRASGLDDRPGPVGVLASGAHGLLGFAAYRHGLLELAAVLAVRGMSALRGLASPYRSCRFPGCPSAPSRRSGPQLRDTPLAAWLVDQPGRATGRSRCRGRRRAARLPAVAASWPVPEPNCAPATAPPTPTEECTDRLFRSTVAGARGKRQRYQASHGNLDGIHLSMPHVERIMSIIGPMGPDPLIYIVTNAPAGSLKVP